MSTYEDANRKVQNDNAQGRTGFDAEAARRMAAEERQRYEKAWKDAQKK